MGFFLTVRHGIIIMISVFISVFIGCGRMGRKGEKETRPLKVCIEGFWGRWRCVSDVGSSREIRGEGTSELRRRFSE